MAKQAMNFKSGGAYKKWLAYGHMHGDFAASPGNTPVKVKGKAKKVKHASMSATDRRSAHMKGAY